MRMRDYLGSSLFLLTCGGGVCVLVIKLGVVENAEITNNKI